MYPLAVSQLIAGDAGAKDSPSFCDAEYSLIASSTDNPLPARSGKEPCASFGISLALVSSSNVGEALMPSESCSLSVCSVWVELATCCSVAALQPVPIIRIPTVAAIAIPNTIILRPCVYPNIMLVRFSIVSPSRAHAMHLKDWWRRQIQDIYRTLANLILVPIYTQKWVK